MCKFKIALEKLNKFNNTKNRIDLVKRYCPHNFNLRDNDDRCNGSLRNLKACYFCWEIWK